MARFYGEIQGNRGMASRMGTPASGMEAHVRGWDIGVRVYLSVDRETGRDHLTVIRTGGSNAPRDGEVILDVVEPA